MKTLFFILLFFVTFFLSAAQQSKIDSLKRELEANRNDTMRLVLFTLLENSYHDKNNDSAFYFSTQALALAQKLHYKIEEAQAMVMMGYNRFDDITALNLFLKAADIAEEKRNEKNILPARYAEKMIYSDINLILLSNERNGHNFRMAVLANLYFNLGSFYGLS
jgi:hypothetical protein